MTLLQMQYILEIDRCGSMNKAARSLFVSQSALSSAILEVEKELGIQVFYRSNRGIRLTEEGRYLVTQISPLVEAGQKLNRYYARRKAQDLVRLSVAAQRYPFCAKAFVKLLQEIDGPMQVALKEMDMASVIAEVAAGRSDLGVLFVSDLTEHSVVPFLHENDLQFTPLLTLRPHVFMRRGHPLSAERSLRVDQLRPYPNVVFAQSDSNPNFAEEAVAGLWGDFERTVTVSDRATIYNIMAHTDCVCTGSGILPDGYCDESLIALPLENVHAMRLGTVHLRQHALSPWEQRFVELLHSCAEESKA